MVRKIQAPIILCTWEIGGELGHISRFSKIVKTLEMEGYQVIVALKDLSRAFPFFCDTNARLLQAPVWLPKITMQRPIACLADALLLLGYLEPDPLHCLTLAWQAMVDMVKPDLVIFDYSPTAMLALTGNPIPKILIGTGFADPVPGHPLADWRPHAFSDQLIERQELRVLQQVNRVLNRQDKPALAQLADLFAVDRVLISTFPELDLYRELRKGKADYCTGATAKVTAKAIEFKETGRPRILAYLQPAYPQLQPLIAALALCNADVFIACPQGQPEMFQPHLSDHFQFSIELVDLQGAMATADLFVGHGSSSSVKESLVAGNPILVLPIQLEQLLTGKKLQEAGLGLLVEKIPSQEAMVDLLNNFLADTSPYRARIASLLSANPQPGLSVPDAVKAACAQLLGQNQLLDQNPLLDRK